MVHVTSVQFSQFLTYLQYVLSMVARNFVTQSVAVHVSDLSYGSVHFFYSLVIQ